MQQGTPVHACLGGLASKLCPPGSLVPTGPGQRTGQPKERQTSEGTPQIAQSKQPAAYLSAMCVSRHNPALQPTNEAEREGQSLAPRLGVGSMKESLGLQDRKSRHARHPRKNLPRARSKALATGILQQPVRQNPRSRRGRGKGRAGCKLAPLLPDRQAALKGRWCITLDGPS